MAKPKKRKKQKGRHSSPETSGVQNLSEAYINRIKGSGGGVVKGILEIYKRGNLNSNEYKGLWDSESLERELMEYFEFCAENDIKPAKAGIRMWLGISKSRYWEWEQGNDYKANLLEQASDFMELQYIGNLEKHPQGNIFLLKAIHKYSDRQEITVNQGEKVDTDKINDVVAKLGLDRED